MIVELPKVKHGRKQLAQGIIDYAGKVGYTIFPTLYNRNELVCDLMSGGYIYFDKDNMGIRYQEPHNTVTPAFTIPDDWQAVTKELDVDGNYHEGAT
jgi:hypothetical protein